MVTPHRTYLSNVNAITHLHISLYHFTSLLNIFTNPRMVTNQNNKKTKLLPHLVLQQRLQLKQTEKTEKIWV